MAASTSRPSRRAPDHRHQHVRLTELHPNAGHHYLASSRMASPRLVTRRVVFTFSLAGWSFQATKEPVCRAARGADMIDACPQSHIRNAGCRGFILLYMSMESPPLAKLKPPCWAGALAPKPKVPLGPVP
ncbi:hypothetical protein HYQ44_007372 [Verticillium longisporum]|nr:hypothetical protein HYQ44_007372 [Verticillium longisporum]